MKEAEFYKKLTGNAVQCYLCPHHCRIEEGNAGICQVRLNNDGQLLAYSYGLISAMHSDPIEKKPLYHFYPGKSTWSIGSYGCNFRCEFCQNWQISQCKPAKNYMANAVTCQEVLKLASQQSNSIGISFTYNEPAVNYEFMLELAVMTKSSGMSTVMVTNGYIAEKPLNKLLPYMDAFNVDLKLSSEDKHLQVTGARLKPVLRTLKSIRKAGKHLEITHLVVTGINDHLDQFGATIDWIQGELGKETILHISRYFPSYRYTRTATSTALLTIMYNKAIEKLHYAYLGNTMIEGSAHTYCSKCKSIVIERYGYQTILKGLDNLGDCQFCGHHIIDHL